MCMEREGGGRLLYFSSFRFFLRFTEIGPQIFVGAEGKVDPRNKGYAWTPKSWFFHQTPKDKEFSYLYYF